MATSADILGQLNDYSSKMETPEQALAEQNGALGVDAAQQKVSGLRTAINNTTTLLKQVAPSIMGRTADSLVTNAQATRQIANESAPINDTLLQQNQDYNTANDDYTRTSSKAQQLADVKITGQNNQRSYLMDLYKTALSSEQEQAKLAESQRQANMSSAASSASPSFGGMSGGSSPAPTAPPQFPKGTAPAQVVGQLFQGYQPGANPGYTEQVVIPTLYRLMVMNNGSRYTDDFYKQAATNLAYRYRKSTFGE